MTIGLISDTHGFLDPKVFEHFADVDEIWHAGDFGTIELSDELAAFKPLVGVYGNIDSGKLRQVHPLDQHFEREGVKIYMTHIGGYPGKYSPHAREQLQQQEPSIFICGHSHICKVMKDEKYHLLHINPGAAGKSGFHVIKTIVKLEINNGKITDLKVIELGKRAAL